ncbi:hypothetical protein COMA2_10266 [Candidatus Nitrospira nitrificans]|uniref:Uncharacterized protein n=1 Tax=Candidatus Nitrospira nitrificans TaxID=1742973 RepID=A0A0S4L571_9BACT|nr:hypothetical protein COMA2_10266 [Candidatus Nitrospira nitrificans]
MSYRDIKDHDSEKTQHQKKLSRHALIGLEQPTNEEHSGKKFREMPDKARTDKIEPYIGMDKPCCDRPFLSRLGDIRGLLLPESRRHMPTYWLFLVRLRSVI